MALAIKKIRLGVIVFYLVLFAGLALYDERPDPNMLEEMTRPLPAFTGPENAYIAFLGFDAPTGKTPYGSGQEKLRKMEKAFAAGTNLGDYLSLFDNNKGNLAFKGERPAFYDKKDKGILNYLSAHPAEAAKLISENKELLQRYRSLFSYTEYREPLDYGYYIPLPMITPVRSVQTLYFLEIADEARHGDIAEALTRLQQDMKFWRRITSDSSTLISKLVSMAMVRTDICLAAELGSVRTLSPKETALLQNILRPFDDGEAALDTAFRGEARYMYKGAELSMKQSAGFIDKLFYKRNATDNRIFAGMQDMIKLAELAPDKFAKEAKLRESENYGYRRMGLPFLYNPAGELLALIGQSQGLYRYIEKGYNLEGLRRLALLKVLANKEHARPEQMQQFLDVAPTGLKDPYTNGPMKWDVEKGSIYFKFVTDDKRVELFL
jgi:hypothetical protein